MKNGAGLGALLWAAATHSNETIVHSSETILRIVPPAKFRARIINLRTRQHSQFDVIPNRAPKECEEGPYVRYSSRCRWQDRQDPKPNGFGQRPTANDCSLHFLCLTCG